MMEKLQITGDDYQDHRESLRDRYRISDAWRDLGFEGEPARSCRCPWREDRKPSFSVFDDGRRFKDFSTDEAGDVFGFVMLALGLPFTDAIKWIEDRTGLTPTKLRMATPVIHRSLPETEKKKLSLPPLDRGTVANQEAVARSRGLHPYVVKMAMELGTLRFGKICGSRSWILLDGSMTLAEARRVDGRPFEAIGKLPLRKAHTLAGSSKSWPLGLKLSLGGPEPGRGILLVEGGPDYLAALAFLVWFQRRGFQPVAMLGKSNRMPSEALEMLAGRRVRIYPHHDPGGGGMEAAQAWHDQLAGHGCKVDGFSFEGLNRKDGKPVTDLNDLLLANEEGRKAWKGVLP